MKYSFSQWASGSSRVVLPWHFKTSKDITTKFKRHRFQIIKINRKKLCGSGITPSYFPALMNMAIFHNTETRDRTDYKPAFYLEGFLGVATI